ncbi:uncharacterized protein NECHADRAFT_43035 [Fusarium vanettenii 77-13-4]|uniref:Uncharacterized protein n=1 Tax=Fusarium vanettenii (strain ATCC MYA-4622 / CBS 123669 / FGSC 9596 / NRRL 45880 / 77-13-4) TaxID=660122 RepID=C7ZAN6_FUSV7|nr:uncharacterized protein NECHADRAFT_43035 [Fusarium vanettenii 77-13-4]EEU39710.1 hypothetical protein NECHADRAFT_43035 [Fusarium vanettenii 77-13-4]
MLSRILLTLDAAGLLLGTPIADMNETHQYNPRWPPHAKFHNGQTITLSIMLGLLTLYYTWRPATGISSKDSLTTAMIFGSIYWAAGLCAQFYPEASGLDPEFGGPGFPQAKIFTAFMCCGIAGWLCDRWEV